MKQELTELTGETDKSVIIIGDFEAPFSVIDKREHRQGCGVPEHPYQWAYPN
jgi:hypothetical protein